MPSSKVLFYLINLNGVSAAALIMAYLLSSNPAHWELLPQDDGSSGQEAQRTEAGDFPVAAPDTPRRLHDETEAAPKQIASGPHLSTGTALQRRNLVASAEPENAYSAHPVDETPGLPASSFAPARAADAFLAPSVAVTLKHSGEPSRDWISRPTGSGHDGGMFGARQPTTLAEAVRLTDIGSSVSTQADTHLNGSHHAFFDFPPGPNAPAQTRIAGKNDPANPGSASKSGSADNAVPGSPDSRAPRHPREATQIATVENRLLSPASVASGSNDSEESSHETLRAPMLATTALVRPTAPEDIDPARAPALAVIQFEDRLLAKSSGLTGAGRMTVSIDSLRSAIPRDVFVCLPSDGCETVVDQSLADLSGPGVSTLPIKSGLNYAAQTVFASLLARGTNPGLRPSPPVLGFDAVILPSVAATSYDDLDVGQATAKPQVPQWFSHTIRGGDTLTSIWRNAGMPPATLFSLLGKGDNTDALNRIRPGQQIEWRVDSNGEIERLRLWHSQTRGVEWIRSASGEGFMHKDVQAQRELSHLIIAGQVKGTLSGSIAALDQVPPSSTDALVALIDRHVPVRAKAADGDRFALLVEQETYAGDDLPHDVRLLAYHYRGREIDVSGVRFSDNRFYAPDGKVLAPPFDRYPFVGNFRVSSPFNPRRRHPVSGRVAPHLGTDFPMPVGTPVMAPADGTVIRVDNHARAGRYVEIEHGEGYRTRYLHLQQALVKKGQRVQRGQRIALSGNSGRTTAPHLHYELHINGQPVDPMHANLPAAGQLAGTDLERFERIATPLLEQMRDVQTPRQIAMRPFSELGL